MAMTATARFAFEGRFIVASFLDFVVRRAERLDVKTRIVGADDRNVTIDVTGQPDLIDAFEMACSLGPLDCLVMDCRSTAPAVSEMETSDR